MLRDIVFYLKRLSKFLRETIYFLLVFLSDCRQKKGSGADIRIGYNGYSKGPQKDWFTDFLRAHTGQNVVASWCRPTIIISSSFGSYWLLKIILAVFKVPSLFFSEENLATLKKYREYSNYLGGQPTLAMGFDYNHAENYRRFPLWLLYIFPPDFAARASVQDIQQQLDNMEKLALLPKKKFAAMVASHDGYASEKKVYGCLHRTSRSSITEQIATVGFVHCPGKLLHNDDSLKMVYNDDKKSYLKEFLFNICAENASVQGYVTEKIFEAIEGGTIPIYWGTSKPEAEILNQNRIIFWEESKIKEVLQRIQEISSDNEVRQNFLRQPVFTNGAAKEIYNYFFLLKKDIDSLFLKKGMKKK